MLSRCAGPGKSPVWTTVLGEVERSLKSRAAGQARSLVSFRSREAVLGESRLEDTGKTVPTAPDERFSLGNACVQTMGARWVLAVLERTVVVRSTGCGGPSRKYLVVLVALLALTVQRKPNHG